MKILFLSIRNSGRTLIAESLAKFIFGRRIEVASAGSSPALKPAPWVQQVLHEIDLDILSGPKKISALPTRFTEELDYVITLCGATSCPILIGKSQSLHWDLPDLESLDPDDRKGIQAFCDAREEIRHRLLEFRSTPTEDLFKKWGARL